MFKSIKNKIISFIAICLTVVSITSGIVILLNKKINAVADSSNITVKRDTFKEETNGEFIFDNTKNIFVKAEGSEESIKQYKLESTHTLQDHDVVMLNDNQQIDVEFKIPAETDEKVISLLVTLTLNGVPMDTEESISIEENFTFNQILNFKKSLSTNKTNENNTTLSGNDLQGLYTYNFRYVTDLHGERTSTISFYMINKSFYLDYNTERIQPRLVNTEKIDRDFYSTLNVEKNFFNFNNKNTTNYYDDKSDNTLQFPTYYYDASKYNLSWTYTLHGLTYNYTTEFIVENGQGVVNIYKDGVKQTNWIVKTDCTKFNKDSSFVFDFNNTIYTSQIKFENVGEYKFKIVPVVACIENNTVTYKTILDSNSEQLIEEKVECFGDVNLDIFGYQLYYTNYNEDITDLEGNMLENIEFKNDKNSSDISNTILNYNSITDDDLKNNIEKSVNAVTKLFKQEESLTDDDKTNIKNLFNENIVTNQAPVSFAQYFATMGYDDNTLISKSTYAYFENESTTPHIYELTNNTKLSKNGYYILKCVYGYINYEYLNNGEIKTHGFDSDDKFTQYFAFRINNVEPDVKMYENVTSNDPETIDSNDLRFYAGDVTKYDVWFTYTTSKVFDVKPTITVEFKDSQQSNYSIASKNTHYQIIADGQYLIISPDNLVRWWKVTLQYGPNKSTSAIYEFVTDTTPIESSAFSVTINKDTSDNTYTGKYYVTEEIGNGNEFIVSNQNFYMSYTQNKDSGAVISSSYMFIPLDKQNYSDFYDTNNTNSFEYIYNGFSLNENSTIYEYGLANIESVNGKDYLLNENANFVLTNAGLYVFKFIDSAGNVNYKVVLLDTSSPLLLIDCDLKDNDEKYIAFVDNYSIYLDSVKLIYGKYKALDISSLKTTDLSNAITNFTAQDENFNVYNLMANKFETGSKIYFGIEIDKNNISFNVKNNATGNYSTLPYGYILKLEKTEDEAEYEINVSDMLNNKSKQQTIKLSTDNSLVTAYKYTSSLTGSDIKINQSLSEMAVSNDKYLYVSWINNSGDYAISSLKCYYYPLTYDVNSKNYPYSEAHTEETNLLSNFVSGNMTAETDGYGYAVSIIATPFSNQGMYVIEREYIENVPADSLDMKNRKYIFFIDRNNIFQVVPTNNDTTFNIGETITMTVGDKIENSNDDTYQISLDYNNFILNGSNNTLFETNKLPVILNNIIANLNKYTTNSSLNNAENNTTDISGSIFENIHSSYISNINNWINVIERAFKLNVKVTFNGIEQEKNNFNFINAGKYSINITDSSSNEEDTPISFILSFTIEKIAPSANFISTNENGFVSLGDEPYVNYTDGVKLVWSDPTDEYLAKINNDLIKVQINGTLIDAIVNKVTDKAWDYEIDLENYINFVKNEDKIVEITLEYYNNKGYEYYTTTKTIYFDFTAPNLNYNRLLNADNFLTKAQKDNFENLNSEINFENYAFTIDKNFAFSANSFDFTNTQQLYYRQYNKYEEVLNSEDIANLQSIVPGDSRYDNLDLYPRLRFAEYLDDYTPMQISLDNSLSFFEYVGSKSGYFEIIEIDKAGNCRIFTVYIPDNELTFTYTKNNIELQTETNEKDVEINSKNAVLNSINLNRNIWSNVEISQNNKVIHNIKLSPIQIAGYMLKEDIVNLFNQVCLNIDEVNGTTTQLKIYYQEILNNNTLSNNNSVTFTINYPSKQLELIFNQSIENGTKLLAVTIPQEQNGTKIINLDVYKSENGEYKEILNDYNGNPINQLEENAGVTFYFEISAGADFKFVVTDNFDRQYAVRKIIGLEDVATLEFNNEYRLIDNIYYTAGQTQAVYQSKIYSCSIYAYDENGKLITTPLTQADLQNLNITISEKLNGLCYVTLFNTNLLKIQRYKIVIKDANTDSTEIAGKTFEYIVEYMPLVGKVEVKDNSGEILFENNNINTVTPRTCYVYINDSLIPNGLETTVTGTYTSPEGIITDLGVINNGDCLSDVGKYNLTIFNSLGTVNYILFEIRSSFSKDVSVITSQGQILTPSNTKYTFNGNDIDWYFTIYDYNIELSSVRYTTSKVEATYDDGKTIVYRLSNEENSQFKFIAVTTVANNSNFINSYENHLIINGNIASTSQIKITDQSVNVSLEKAYNQFEGNNIIVYYTYKNSPLIKLDSTSITLTEAGIYSLYFADLAGNTQLFNNQEYYKIYLFNEIIIYVNDEQKIENAVYNSSVTVAIQEPQQYTNTNFVLNATKNGSPISIKKINNSYTFTEYGVYNIKISGLMDGKTLTTTLNFVILNQKEAYATYEFIAYSNYEITKIVKDNVDVTEEIRQQLSNKLYNSTDSVINNITSLTLSGFENGIGGNGFYTITVLARNINANINTEFSFNVWINCPDEVYLLSSINAGSSTTNSITIKINTTQIFEKVGMCNITINDRVWLSIDENGQVIDNTNSMPIILVRQSDDSVSYSTYKLTTTGQYNFKIQTLHNNTIMSFTVTKNEPLNSTAIFVIVISVIACGAIVTIFLLLRKRMRVK